MTSQPQNIGGVDSHRDTIHVALITGLGHPVADQEFPTTTAGYRRAVAWLIEHGPLQAVVIEGTSSYGLGIATAVTAAAIRVAEVNRTRPAERRKQGKSDQLDAYRAARSMLSGEATTDPKRASIEPLRGLNIARRSALKARQAAWRQIGSRLANAPTQLRDRYRHLPEAKLVAALASPAPTTSTTPTMPTCSSRCGPRPDATATSTKRSPPSSSGCSAGPTGANPGLLAIKGIGPVIGAYLLITAVC